MKRLASAAVGFVVAFFSITGTADASSWAVPLAAVSHGESNSQPLPSSPRGVTSSCQTPASSKQLEVTWTAVSEATTYQVWQSHNSGAYSSVATTAATSWTSASGLSTGTYAYEVKALIATNWISASSSPGVTRSVSLVSPYCS